MSEHPPLEVIASMSDGVASPDVTAHVAQCDACARILEEMTARAADLRRLPAAKLPPQLWPRIVAAMSDVPGGQNERPSLSLLRARPATYLARIAAGLILVLGGGVAERWLLIRDSETTAVAHAIQTSGDGDAAALAATESAYIAAISRYAEAHPADSATSVARLAAFEGITRTAETAAASAPNDVILTSYLQVAQKQRSALWRGAALASNERWF